MAINGRQDLIDFTLRSLGSPVLQINVTAEQLEDRLDDTLAIWAEYNMEGTNREYIRHQVTEQEIYQEWIEIPYDTIMGIIRVLPVRRSMMGNIALPFDANYMMLQNLMNMQTGGWASIDLTSYSLFREYAETIDLLLRPKPNIRFNRFQEKLFIDWTWSRRNWNTGRILTEDSQIVLHEEDTPGDDAKEGLLFELELPGHQGGYHGMGSSPDIYAGDWIILECHKILDPEEYPRVYNSTWIKRYYKEKVKYQFGVNLSKYSGMVLPGGVQLDGRSMMQEAEEGMSKLFDSLFTDYAEPLQFFVG